MRVGCGDGKVVASLRAVLACDGERGDLIWAEERMGVTWYPLGGSSQKGHCLCLPSFVSSCSTSRGSPGTWEV